MSNTQPLPDDRPVGEAPAQDQQREENQDDENEDEGEDDEEYHDGNDRAHLFADMLKKPKLREQVTQLFAPAALPYLKRFIEKGGNDKLAEGEKIPQHCRCFWSPVYEQKSQVPITKSKVGGLPLLSSDASWPSCVHCSVPLTFVLQLNIGELPLPLQQAFGRKDSNEQVVTNEVLQLFTCEDYDCNFNHMSFGDLVVDSAVLRFVSLAAPLAALTDGTFVKPDNGRQAPVEHEISGWKLSDQEDFCIYPEEYSSSSSSSPSPSSDLINRYFNESLPCPDMKLGGFGAYVEHDFRGKCSVADCGAHNHLVLQLSASGPLQQFFERKYAKGFILQCPHHPQLLKYVTDGCMRV